MALSNFLDRLEMIGSQIGVRHVSGHNVTTTEADLTLLIVRGIEDGLGALDVLSSLIVVLEDLDLGTSMVHPQLPKDEPDLRKR